MFALQRKRRKFWQIYQFVKTFFWPVQTAQDRHLSDSDEM